MSPLFLVPLFLVFGQILKAHAQSVHVRMSKAQRAQGNRSPSPDTPLCLRAQ